jgi:hypothetical protein
MSESPTLASASSVPKTSPFAVSCAMRAAVMPDPGAAGVAVPAWPDAP